MHEPGLFTQNKQNEMWKQKLMQIKKIFMSDHLNQTTGRKRLEATSHNQNQKPGQ